MAADGSRTCWSLPPLPAGRRRPGQVGRLVRLGRRCCRWLVPLGVQALVWHELYGEYLVRDSTPGWAGSTGPRPAPGRRCSRRGTGCSSGRRCCCWRRAGWPWRLRPGLRPHPCLAVTFIVFRPPVVLQQCLVVLVVRRRLRRAGVSGVGLSVLVIGLAGTCEAVRFFGLRYRAGLRRRRDGGPGLPFHLDDLLHRPPHPEHNDSVWGRPRVRRPPGRQRERQEQRSEAQSAVCPQVEPVIQPERTRSRMPNASAS